MEKQGIKKEILNKRRQNTNIIRNHKLHYAWVICAVCTLVLFCSYGMTVSTISVYLPYMTEHGSLTQFQASMQPTVRGLAGLISMLFVEQLLKKTGVRVALTLVLLEGAFSFFVYGRADSMVGYTVASALSGFLFGLAGMVPVSIMITAWFQAHKTLALGICAAGSGVASIILPPVITRGIERFSLRGAFFLLAFVLIAVAGIAFFTLRNSPQEIGAEPLRGQEKIKEKSNVPKMEDADRQTVFFMLANALILALISFGTLPYLNTLFIQSGFDPMKVSLAYSLYGVATMLCKFLYGHVTDSIGSSQSYIPFYAAYIVGIVLCCSAGKTVYPVVVLIMLLHGVGMPLTTVGIPVFAGDISSGKSFPAKLRTTQMVFTAGSMIAGPITGAAAQATGDYKLAFSIHTVLGIIGFFCVTAAYRRLAKRQ